jgi:hypothetical protein
MVVSMSAIFAALVDEAHIWKSPIVVIEATFLL